jgi:hypothetical protein
MSLEKTYIKKVKNISIGGSLSVLLAAGFAAGLQSCSDNSSESDADYEVSESYTTGVKTFIKETEPGKFQITDEVTVAADSSKAVITYLDGRVETMSKEQSKNMIDKEISQNRTHVGHGYGLGSVLLHGGMGYFLARTLSPNYGQYRPMNMYDQNNGNATTTSATAANRKYYANDAAFNKSTEASSNISKSRTVSTRPSASKGGFFGRSSRGGGFGG